ncbi:hypothetical protein KBB25_03985 [Candidatus Gracilibacteria bacterium]|nr:hypothetical protein [Candidatus Gracilibacteria bacterium]
MKIGNTGTTGFFSRFGSGSEQKSREPTPQNKPSIANEPPLGESDQVPHVIISTTQQIQKLMILPPASYVARLYSQNQE